MKTRSIPTEAVAIYNQALDLANKKDYTAAINKYRQAIEIHPSFIEAYNNIGEIYSGMGDSIKAMGCYAEGLKIKRNHKILLNIGVEFYKREEYSEALRHFLDSLCEDRNYIEGNLYTALTYYNMNDLKSAEGYFMEVIRYDRFHLKSNYLLSTIYYDWKEYDKALACLDNIKDTYEDKAFIEKYYGFCCYFTGRYPEAVKHLTAALESRPGYEKFKDFLESLTYENRVKEIKNIDGEIKKLEQKILDDFTGIKDYTKLSMLYIFQGKNSKAEKLLLKAKEKMAS